MSLDRMNWELIDDKGFHIRPPQDNDYDMWSMPVDDVEAKFGAEAARRYEARKHISLGMLSLKELAETTPPETE